MTNSNIGAVVIGRNEGERLKICLDSLVAQTGQIVYVDSGSTDDSVAMALKKGVDVLALDMSQPFTAARARNAGFQKLLSLYPEIEFVQFIDGDCQLAEGWLAQGASFLADKPNYAVVFGKLTERFPERSVYNLLCDIEWNTAFGEVNSCGGIALIRTACFQQVNGFKEGLIAGEEPELCYRFRQHGWLIYRLEADMAKHDAAILRFSQWWRRCKRAGFAYAEGSALHGKSKEKYWLKETRSLLFWGGILPVTILALGSFVNPWFFTAYLVYFLQIAKITFIKPVDKNSLKKSFLYAFFVMLAKFPQFLGAIKFFSGKLFNQKSQLIEYK